PQTQARAARTAPGGARRGGSRVATVNVRCLDSRDSGFADQLAEILSYASSAETEVDETVAKILADVRARGDLALLDYTRRFDRFEPATMSALQIGSEELRASLEALPSAQRHALEVSAERIRAYHEK